MADRRGIDEREVWSWTVERVLLWAHYYARKDGDLDSLLAQMQRGR